MDHILLIAFAVLVVAVAGLLLLNWRGRRERLHLYEQSTHGPRDVQCPRCDRWKKLSARESTYEEAVFVATESQVEEREIAYVNQYHCPFCGYEWREDYLI